MNHYYSKRKKFLKDILCYGELMQDFPFEIVTIHPLADEVDLLNQLKLEPEQCNYVGFYWLYRNKKYFVSVVEKESNETGVTYLGKQKGYYSFTVFISNVPVTKAKLLNVILFLSKWLDNNKFVSAKQPEYITNADITQSN